VTDRPPTLVRPVAGVTDSRRIAADLCADLRGGKLLDAAFEARRKGVLDGLPVD